MSSLEIAYLMGRGGAASHSGHASRWGCTSNSNPALPCWVNIFSSTTMCLNDLPAPSPSLSFPITSSQASCWFCSWTLSLSRTCDCPADLLIAWVFLLLAPRSTFSVTRARGPPLAPSANAIVHRGSRRASFACVSFCASR